MILETAEHVPFYRRHWADAGVDLTRVYSAVHLEFLPVVTRADLLACPPEDRLDKRYHSRALHGMTTVAPNGQRYEMPMDRRTQRRRRSRFAHALREVGYLPGERVMLIATPPFPTGASLMRWTYVDSRLDEEALFDKYRKTRPHVLHAPLSALVSIARRVTPDMTWQPKLIVSTGEPLTDARRALLTTAFGAKVADFYGMTEFGLVGYSRPGFSGYRMLKDEFHFELLPTAPGRRGGLERLVITDLIGGPMPLIRFDTGDLVHREPSREGALTSALDAAPILGISGRAADCPKPASGPRLSPEEVPLTLDHIGNVSMA
jgi:phenylacetate-CoA ligase